MMLRWMPGVGLVESCLGAAVVGGGTNISTRDDQHRGPERGDYQQHEQCREKSDAALAGPSCREVFGRNGRRG